MPNHILIVEDNTQLSRMYQKVLNHEGYRTLLVSTAEEAIESLSEFDPDVICLDWQLANTTSSPILDHLRKMDVTDRPAVLVVSGHLERGMLVDYQDLVDAYLPKPATLSELVWCVQGVIPKTKNRRLKNQLQVDKINPEIVVVHLTGRIGRNILELMQQPALQQAKTIIFHLQEVYLEDLPRSSDNSPHLSTPNLQEIYLVAEDGHQTNAQYLQQAIPHEIKCRHFTNLDQAIYEAALTEI